MFLTRNIANFSTFNKFIDLKKKFDFIAFLDKSSNKLSLVAPKDLFRYNLCFFYPILLNNDFEVSKLFSYQNYLVVKQLPLIYLIKLFDNKLITTVFLHFFLSILNLFYRLIRFIYYLIKNLKHITL